MIWLILWRMGPRCVIFIREYAFALQQFDEFFFNYYFLIPVQVNQADMELSVAPDKVQIVKWHPLAKDILCTVAFDKSVKIWDLNKTENGPQLELQVQIKL